jgi:hypothetical protein
MAEHTEWWYNTYFVGDLSGELTRWFSWFARSHLCPSQSSRNELRQYFHDIFINRCLCSRHMSIVTKSLENGGVNRRTWRPFSLIQMREGESVDWEYLESQRGVFESHGCSLDDFIFSFRG